MLSRPSIAILTLVLSCACCCIPSIAMAASGESINPSLTIFPANCNLRKKNDIEFKQIVLDIPDTNFEKPIKNEANQIFKQVSKDGSKFFDIGSSFYGLKNFYLPNIEYTKEELPIGLEDFWNRQNQNPVLREITLAPGTFVPVAVSGAPKFRAMAVARIKEPRKANEHVVRLEILLLRLNPLRWETSRLNPSHILSMTQSSGIENEQSFFTFNFKPESRPFLQRFRTRNLGKSIDIFVQNSLLAEPVLLAGDISKNSWKIRFYTKDEMLKAFTKIADVLRCSPSVSSDKN